MAKRGYFFFSSRRRHTRWTGDWSSDVCSSDLGFCSQSLVGPACLVCGIAFFAYKPEARLVYLARREGARPASQQLAIVVWPFRVEIRPHHQPVLLPSLLHGTARSELAQSPSPERHVRRHALLALPWRGRVSNRRRVALV